MNRRALLSRIALAAPALILGDAALEAFERLTHQRKSFPSALLSQGYPIPDGGWEVILGTPAPPKFFMSQGVYRDIIAQEKTYWRNR